MRTAIRDLAIPGADPVPGILRLRRHEPGEDLREEAARAGAGRLDYLDRAAIRDRLESDRYRHGLSDPSAFHIHPLNTLRGIAAEVERLGGRIFEQSPAKAIALDGPVKTVETPGGRVEAPQVVLCTGGYTDALVPRLRRAMLPIATYVMVSEEAPDLLATAIHTRAAVSDDRRAGDYYRLVAGGRRLLWGGRITTRAANVPGITRQLRREMLTVYPQLAALGTELAWSGLMSYARHKMPQIGRLGPGAWHCTAFGGHGLNTTAIGGTVVAEAVLGRSERIEAFAPYGLDWTGGPAGLVAAQLTYWGLQARDRWRERAA
jgi:gamma-glutamylputrescine oxidase